MKMGFKSVEELKTGIRICVEDLRKIFFLSQTITKLLVLYLGYEISSTPFPFSFDVFNLLHSQDKSI